MSPLISDPDDWEMFDITSAEPISIQLPESVDDGVTAHQLFNYSWLEWASWWHKLRHPKRWWRARRAVKGRDAGKWTAF